MQGTAGGVLFRYVTVVSKMLYMHNGVHDVPLINYAHLKVYFCIRFRVYNQKIGIQHLKTLLY